MFFVINLSGNLIDLIFGDVSDFCDFHGFKKRGGLIIVTVSFHKSMPSSLLALLSHSEDLRNHQVHRIFFGDFGVSGHGKKLAM
jgi:hypothetical protein